ncbi:hypothetical protein ABMA27_001339 [Loxostege sticticalis]|uniref:FLYWCH-type domain-containing protein n=1 Tax=Loxostege sticticalis TaxID=481309 RepID=A0ABR3HY57_LOXSC
MVQNYTFSRSNKNSIVWACSSRHASRCEAKVKIDKDGTLVYHLLTHNHPPPKYHVTNTGDYIKIKPIDYKIIKSSRGKLVMVQGYTFSSPNKQSIVWTCSSRNSNRCTAKVKIDRQGTLACDNLAHNHPPPKYHITDTGVYVKI